MAGYTRFDVTSQIADTNVINAAPLNGEFDAIQAAFNAGTGHKHDGTSTEGAPITAIGPAQDVVATSAVLRPKTDNVVDLGTSTLEFKDLWIDGTANIDSLVADTADINAGTIDATIIGSTTPAAATVTTLTATSGTVGGAAIVNISTVQTLTNKTLTSPVITGGTIDGVAPATISGTQTLTNKTINLTNNTLVATSAQLAAAITDETGTGAVVFAGSPALTGTPTAPTAVADTNTTQLATTAHVFAERTNTATLTNKTLTAPVISGGSISGITDLAIADGGTGASTAANALINFGLTATANQLNALSNDDRIINGNMEVWQRGASGTVNGYTAADRWANFHVGGTVTQSQQAHPLGTTFGVNNPNLFLRQSVSGQSLSTHFASTTQRIENVRNYAGQTVTVMGWAKRGTGTGNMAVEFVQNFGTGGGESLEVTGIGSAQVALAGSWAPFAVTAAVPTVSGKTIGSNLDSYLALQFWTSAGSTFNARTGSLGVQTIGVDLWGVHMRVGTFTTADVDSYIQTPFDEVLRQCERFYETGSLVLTGNFTSGAGYFARNSFRTIKRATPVFTRASTFNSQFPTTGTISGASIFVQDDRTANATGAGGFATTWTADAEL